MIRLAEKHYRQRLTLAMTLYVGSMLLWPLARTTGDLPLEVLLALLPAVPMLYVAALMVQRVRHGDELRQRTYLVALGLGCVVGSADGGARDVLAAAGATAIGMAVALWMRWFPVCRLPLTRCRDICRDA